MLATTIVSYIRHTESGVEHGVAEVSHDASRNRPSWADCNRAIPGFFTGQFLERKEPVTFTLSATDESGRRVQRTVGTMAVLDRIARFAIRRDWTDMAATDSTGRDVTFEVPAFCE